jgi:choline dehydrogenase
VNPFRAIIALIEFFIFGTGFFISMISEYFCYFHSENLPPNHDKQSRALPDLELFWTAAYGSNRPPPLPKGKGAGSIFVQKACPLSVGTVRLSRNGADDVKVDPVVDPKLLSDPRDWDVYRRGIPFSLELAKKMRESGYAIEPALVPPSLEVKDIDDFIRKHAWASQHYVSSCRMKTLEEGGVVDRELKVHGVQGLRIADASIFPAQVASRPQATVVMIAERCADFIRQSWKAPED